MINLQILIVGSRPCRLWPRLTSLASFSPSRSSVQIWQLFPFFPALGTSLCSSCPTCSLPALSWPIINTNLAFLNVPHFFLPLLKYCVYTSFSWAIINRKEIKPSLVYGEEAVPPRPLPPAITAVFTHMECSERSCFELIRKLKLKKNIWLADESSWSQVPKRKKIYHSCFTSHVEVFCNFLSSNVKRW